MVTIPEIRIAGGFGNLPHDLSENFVAWGECHAPFDLDFKSGGVTGCVMSMHNDVIERVTFGSSLEFDSINDRFGYHSWLRVHQQRMPIGRSNLAFKMVFGRDARC